MVAPGYAGHEAEGRDVPNGKVRVGSESGNTAFADVPGKGADVVFQLIGTDVHGVGEKAALASVWRLRLPGAMILETVGFRF